MKHVLFYESAPDVAAKEFAEEDPFVLNGVVRAWHIREWNEIFAEP